MNPTPCRIKTGWGFFPAVLLDVQPKTGGLEGLVRYMAVAETEEEAWLPIAQIYVEQFVWAPLKS